MANVKTNDHQYEKCILITGGSGFIGSHLVHYFITNYPKYYIVNLDLLTYASNYDPMKFPHACQSTCHRNLLSNYKFIQGDIRNYQLLLKILKKENINIIFHFAAFTHVDLSFSYPLLYANVNIHGTQILLEAVREYQSERASAIEKFIYISTDEVYGESLLSYQLEMNQLNPCNPYASTKASAELLVQTYGRCYQLPYIITRSSNIYGPSQYPEKIIPKFILQILRHEPMTIHGSGHHQRTYLYISDALEAFDILLHQGQIREIYNIPGIEERSTLQVANDVFKYLNAKELKQERMEVQYIADRLYNDQRYLLNGEKIALLHWKPLISWDVGLQKTIDAYYELYQTGDLNLHPSDGHQFLAQFKEIK